MEISKLFVQARSATVQIADGGLYHTKAVYQLFLNGQAAGTADTAVTSLYDLQPETEYVLSVRLGAEEVGQCAFRTARESYTLNVRQFGAVGDGVHDDTAAIQAAILHCPADGRVLIPAGRYHVLPLMLKSHVRIELRRGATLLLETDRSKFPILPGMILSTDETDDLNLGSWEGNPLDMYAAFISGMDVEDVVLYGEGVLDGQGDKSDWWQNCKVRQRQMCIRDRIPTASTRKAAMASCLRARISPWEMTALHSNLASCTWGSATKRPASISKSATA